MSCRSTVTGVSSTGWAALTSPMVRCTWSSGTSWGSTAMAPRRATVSAIRRPLIAVMFATTTGIVVPVPSPVVRSTSNREEISE